MDRLLSALGLRQTVLNRWLMIALAGAAVAVMVALMTAVRAVAPWNPVVPQLLGWGAWFGWQGWLFPRRRRAYLAADRTQAYRRAFARDIVPGAAFGVAQMLAPVAYALVHHPTLRGPAAVVAGGLAIGAGVLLFVLGVRTITIAGAIFVFEYGVSAPPLARHSIYSHIRHPLFLGGAIASLGAGLAFGGTWPLLLGLTNIVVLPIYRWTEDRRLLGIFGADYARYRAAVGAFIPWVWPELPMPHQMRKAHDRMANYHAASVEVAGGESHD